MEHWRVSRRCEAITEVDIIKLLKMTKVFSP